MDAPYNFSGTGGDQSHLSPLSTLEPGLPPQDDVFGGGSWERSVLPHEQQTPSHPSMRAPSVPNFAPGRSPYLGHSDSRTHPYRDHRQQQIPTYGFNRPSPGLYHDPAADGPGSAGYHHDRDDLQNQVLHLSAEHGRLSTDVNKLYEQNRLMSEKLTALEKFSLELQAALADVQQPPQEMQKKKNVRNVVNGHPVLKTLVHPLFFKLCHVNKALKKLVRIKLLCEVEPLSAGKPYELCDQKQVWHPDWKGHVDDTVRRSGKVL
ncbi:hypothetical protein F4604DRAFT_1933272 [Suillus subluteus]|nr:hypothetical protein F4604DRAFT_1933272 [Suillus subluteus]